MSHVIIVGAGMAGLAAAKVLANAYSKVTILNPARPSQGHHLHVLLSSGQQSLESFFPGILEKCKQAGCPEIDWAQDTRWDNHTGSFPQNHSSIKTLSMGRQFLEGLLMEELRKLPQISFIEERAIEFNFDKKASLQTNLGRMLEADLIVMTSGQHFSLHKIGQLKSETVLEIDLTYHSLIFKTDELKMDHFKQYYFQVDPPYSSIGGVISPMEEGKCMVTIIEHEKTFSSCKSMDEFKNKARQIPGGMFAEILGDARPINTVISFRKDKIFNRRLKTRLLPQNLIILGDLHASLNPTFGQGMSLALLQVKKLQEQIENKSSTLKLHQEIESLICYPFFLSHLGSRPGGFLKTALRLFLRLCQKSSFFHHLFLIHLHSLGKRRFS